MKTAGMKPFPYVKSGTIAHILSKNPVEQTAVFTKFTLTKNKQYIYHIKVIEK